MCARQRATRAGSPPHAWGQHAARASCSVLRTGSPPHAWGQRGCRTCLRSPLCGSPPHAWGQRLRGGCERPADPVHPHTRGDNDAEYVDWRVRSRFTPTRVGTTHRRRIDARPSSSVHPHTRGDNLRLSGAWRFYARFTPTRVGTTCGFLHSLAGIGSPPHAWGQPAISSLACAAAGSPPHAWGQRYQELTHRLERTVHPHTRGDNSHGIASAYAVLGSPPHAWGQH